MWGKYLDVSSNGYKIQIVHIYNSTVHVWIIYVGTIEKHDSEEKL